MTKNTHNILTDTHGRFHNYLRISLTETCNLRCTYCMPAEGIKLSPRSHMMTSEEIYELAKIFVNNGVTKIRLTGGEPLIRKDFTEILQKLSNLPAKLSLTTNAVMADSFINDFKTYGLHDINVSLDSLNPHKFQQITRRQLFEKTIKNLNLLIDQGFNIKINCVLIKGVNDHEIMDFINLTQYLPISIRFIEFMPFDGNKWHTDKLVKQHAILSHISQYVPKEHLITLENDKHFTARTYQIKGYTGTFGIISSVSNPFCDGCNRIRLTANGRIKNCLFSNHETDLLSALRTGDCIEELIVKSIFRKKKVRAGMEQFSQLSNPKQHQNNRSMVAIGG